MVKGVLKTTVKTIIRLSSVHHRYQAWRSSAALPPFVLLLLLLGWFRQFNSSSETQQKLIYLCSSLISRTPNHMHRQTRDRDQREDGGAENSSLIMKPFPSSIDEHPLPRPWCCLLIASRVKIRTFNGTFSFCASCFCTSDDSGSVLLLRSPPDLSYTMTHCDIWLRPSC